MRIKTLQMKKTAFAVLVVLLLSVAGVTNAFAQTFTVGNLNYSLNGDGTSVTVTGGTDVTGDLVIPENVEQYGATYSVTSIAGYAFRGNTELTSLTIGNSVISIGECAFSYCYNMNTISFGNSLVEIGYCAFENCFSVGSLTIPESVMYIWSGAFKGCSLMTSVAFNAISCYFQGGSGGHWLSECNSLTNLSIGNNVERIPDDFVNGCSNLIGELSIPQSVTSIGSNAFNGCAGFTGPLTIPNSVNSIGSNAFSGCSSLSGILTLGRSLAAIGNNAFFGTCGGFVSINTRAEMPPTLGTNVFASADYDIPVQVPCGSLPTYQSAEGWNVFTNIQEITPCIWEISATANPNNGGNISGAGTYEQGQICTLLAVPNEGWMFYRWEENGEIVSTGTEYSFTVASDRQLTARFKNLNINTIDFADLNVEAICVNNWDVDGDGFLSYAEAAAVTDLGGAFSGNTEITSFDEIQYFTGLTTIAAHAFQGCSNLTSFITVLPESVTSIGDWAFHNCSAFTGDLTIPSSITSVGNHAFYNCSNFTGELTIHEAVTFIGGAAFIYCGFTTLNYNAVDCELDFDNGSILYTYNGGWSSGSVCCFSPFACGEQLTTLNIGDLVQRIPSMAFERRTVDDYYISFVSNSFSGALFIPESVTSIEYSAFAYCGGFTGSLNIPNSVTYIGAEAFSGCTGLDGNLTIGTSVENMGDYAFSNTSFTTLNYNALNCQVDYMALAGCPLLTTVNIGEGVESISSQAFKDMSTLTGVLILPNSLKSIGSQAFYNCYGLEGIVMSNNMKSIGDQAFYNCYGLEGIEMGNGVETIGTEAFRNCGGLRGELTLPETLQSVGNYAFASCDELTTINYNAINCTAMGNAQSPVFYDCASMAHINIGENVESIPNYAFKRCSTVTDMTVAATVPPTVGSSTFGTLQRSIPVTVQCEATAAYQAAQYWNEFTNYNEGFNYVLEVTCDPERGTVVVNKMADCDDPTARVTAYPEMGYAFLGWSENGTLVSEANPYTFTMESSRELQAEFIPGVSYSVTVSVVPAAAGTVTGQGNYNDGSAVTLTATTNPGYAFVNWTENGSVVSTDEEYTFTIHANRNLVANFTPYAYHWDVNIHQYPGNMTAIGVIQIDGVEQTTPTLEIGAFCNDECRGRQLLTYYPQVDRYMVFLMLYGEDGDEMSFKLYDHILEQELTLSCTSLVTFAANTALGNPVNPYVFNFINSQQTPLAEGWTWYSTYIEQEDIEGLQMMTEALNESGVMIKSQTGFIANSGGQWMGNLDEITNESMYMVNTTAATLLDMVGNSAIASQHPITMNSGWNWIGYPMATANSVSVALSDLEAQPNDVLKSQESFATYYEGMGWFGSLNTITPGMGLMYDSKNDAPVTFTYTEGRSGELKRNVTAESNHWVPDMHKYTNNMNVMAVVELDDVELRDSGYELAVFAGNECRGSVRLVYVEPIDRYVAFLTVAGREATDLQFVLFDADENREYGNAKESLVFESDAVVGNTKSMMTVHFARCEQENDWSMIAVYPNPADGGEHFSIVLPAASDQKVRVEIINELGAVVSVAQSSSLPMEMKAPATPGLYTLKIVAEGNAVCFRKLVVK